MDLSLPEPLRHRVLTASLLRRGPDRAIPPVTPATPDACFHRQVHEMHRALAAVPPSGWTRRAPPYPWTVHGLVGHLVGVETYLGGVLGLWPFTPAGPDHDHLGVTEPFVAGTGPGPPWGAGPPGGAPRAPPGAHPPAPGPPRRPPP